MILGKIPNYFLLSHIYCLLSNIHYILLLAYFRIFLFLHPLQLHFLYYLRNCPML